MRVIAVVNQKGGCGKTTTSINLAAFLAREHRRTLVVDMDPQGHATLGLLPDAGSVSRTMYDLLADRAAGGRAGIRTITKTVHENLDVAPADVRLSALPETTVGVTGRENMLADLLDEVQTRYDYTLIDCPPNVGLLTFNALKAASEAIIPINPSFFSLHGIGKMLETLDVLARETGHRVEARALVTLFSGRTQFVRDVAAEIREHLSGRHFATVIRYSVKLAEAASHGVAITHYASRCAGFEDYQALAAELLQDEPAVSEHEVAESGHESSAPESAAAVSLTGDNGGNNGPSGPRPTREGVVFALAAPSARRVQLVGDFNGWTPDANEMQPDGSVWTSILKLGPGRYRYRYVVDGQWRDDPSNPDVEPAPFGGNNSVLVLDDSHSE